jgi:hypothetical protein
VEVGGSVSVPVSVVSVDEVVGISSVVPSVDVPTEGTGPADVASPSEPQLETRKPSDAARTTAGTTSRAFICLPPSEVR